MMYNLEYNLNAPRIPPRPSRSLEDWRIAGLEDWRIGRWECYEAQMFGEARSPRSSERLKGLQAKSVRERLRSGALGVSWEACETLLEP